MAAWREFPGEIPGEIPGEGRGSVKGGSSSRCLTPPRRRWGGWEHPAVSWEIFKIPPNPNFPMILQFSLSFCTSFHLLCPGVWGMWGLSHMEFVLPPGICAPTQRRGGIRLSSGSEGRTPPVLPDSASWAVLGAGKATSRYPLEQKESPFPPCSDREIGSSGWELGTRSCSTSSAGVTRIYWGGSAACSQPSSRADPTAGSTDAGKPGNHLGLETGKGARFGREERSQARSAALFPPRNGVGQLGGLILEKEAPGRPWSPSRSLKGA